MLGLLIIVLVLLALYFLGPEPRKRVTKGFKASCLLKPSIEYKPEQIQSLLSYTTDQINQEIARHTETVKVGIVTIKGIATARLKDVEFGPETQIAPCVPECICRKTGNYDRAAAIHLSKAKATIEATDIGVSLLGGLVNYNTAIKIVVTGLDAIIETDCIQGIMISQLTFDDVTILEPSPDSVVGKLLARIPDQKEKMKAALTTHVIGKNFILPPGIDKTPLLCLPETVTDSN